MNIKNESYIWSVTTRSNAVCAKTFRKIKIQGAHGSSSAHGAPPVGSSSLIRGNRWQMPDSLFTQLFSLSPPPPGSFLVITDRLWRDPELRASAGQSTGITSGLPFHEPIVPDDYPSSIELGKSDLTFVAFSNDLSVTLANCNVLARTKLPSLDKSDKSTAIRV